MYNLPKYKFILNVNGEKTVVFPLYKDDISIEKEKEGDYEFFRTKFSGKLEFIKRDYHIINDAPFETIFKLEIQLRNYETGVYEYYYEGGFVKTDLEIFQGDNGTPEKISLKKLETYDVYKPILDGLRNEYNLIDLKPDKVSLQYNNRPLWQFYVLGGTHVLNVLGGTYWESEVEPTNDFNYIYFTCHFRERIITGYGDTYSVYARLLHNVPNIENDVRWSQVYIDVENFSIASNDILGESATGYKWVIRFDQYWIDIPQFAFVRDGFQENISEFGKIPQGCTNAGKFYKHETGIGGRKMIPLNKSLWGCYSLWIDFARIEDFYTTPYKYDGVMNNLFTYPFTYKLSEIIRVLVKELNSDVTHEGTPEYSEFLYGTGIDNIISGQQYMLIATPKSNFLTKNADQPATRAITTLDDWLKDLFASHKLQWHIDDDNKFRIEHISWYDNGGRYTGTPNVQIDLTNFFCRKTRKKWIYQQNNIKYDKPKMPERYQFEWSDVVSPAFEGQPIRILSEYVDKGQKEEINVRIFTTDVEYMIANAGDISKNNFALFAGIIDTSQNELIGNDSDMSGANNWTAFGTAQMNVNSTVLGKMWVKIPHADYLYSGVQITPNDHGGIYEARNYYDIKFKARKIAGQDQSSWGILRYDPTWGAVYEFFYPEITEQTFEFKNIEASSGIFMIKAGYQSEGIDPIISIDDVEIIPAETYTMPLKSFVINNFQYHLQNADLSWKFLHDKFWAFTMPAPNIIVNGIERVAETLRKGKEQEVEFPYLNDPNNLELIKTDVGNGEIKKLSINLLSRNIKATLKYDTE